MPTKMKFHLRPKTKRKRKWTFISSEKRKSPDDISVFFFFIHSVTKSALQCAANTSSSFAFLRVVLDVIPLSSCTVYRYYCGIFLDDISTREQFAFLICCYRVKGIFHNLCTVLYWPNK